MANRILGIEYGADRIKVVEVTFGRKLKVFNFAVIDNRNVDPARRTEQLNHTLQVRGFEAKDAIIATSVGNSEHRLLTLPPLSTREMHFVMQRESKKLAPAGMAEMVWSYDVLKTKEELGIKKNQILLVSAERPMVDAAQNLLSQSRFKLLQVTTIPEAVLNLLRHVIVWKKMRCAWSCTSRPMLCMFFSLRRARSCCRARFVSILRGWIPKNSRSGSSTN